jgi:hypothetical protein
MTQFRVQRDSVQGAAWLISVCSVAQPGCSMDQYRVWRGSVEGCDVAQLRMGRGSIRVQCGSVQGVAWLSRVRHGSESLRRGSVQGVGWLRSGCSVAQYRVWRGSVQGAEWFI